MHTQLLPSEAHLCGLQRLTARDGGVHICISIDIHMYMITYFVYEYVYRSIFICTCILYLYMNKTGEIDI